jgi:cytidine deaminase
LASKPKSMATKPAATSQQWKPLLTAALAARALAHAPYSGFLVGAALRGANGTIVAGCNIENAAYPIGNCAEASAIATLIMAGERRIVEALVLGWPARLDPPEFFAERAAVGLCPPCGGCRQRLREFAALECPVHLAGPSGIVMTTTVGALLPHSFGPENL